LNSSRASHEFGSLGWIDIWLLAALRFGRRRFRSLCGNAATGGERQLLHKWPAKEAF
jgi:hypothetical protein